MSKSIEEILRKEIKNLHKKLSNIEENSSELYDLLDETRFLAECRKCEREKEYSTQIFEQRYRNCRNEETCILVTRIADKIKQVNNTESAIREDYARKVYGILSKYEPVLVNLREKSDKQWKEVFGTSYSDLSEDKKNAIVALVERDGGIYRLKTVDSIFDD